jgi:hypothetical protein
MLRMRTTSNQSRHDEREPWTDISQVELQLQGLCAGVCVNCAEKTAVLILKFGSGELAVEPCSGACREAMELYFSTPPERWRAPLTRERGRRSIERAKLRDLGPERGYRVQALLALALRHLKRFSCCTA